MQPINREMTTANCNHQKIQLIDLQHSFFTLDMQTVIALDDAYMKLI